jgi:hypothetical protein
VVIEVAVKVEVVLCTKVITLVAVIVEVVGVATQEHISRMAGFSMPPSIDGGASSLSRSPSSDFLFVIVLLRTTDGNIVATETVCVLVVVDVEVSTSVDARLLSVVDLLSLASNALR